MNIPEDTEVPFQYYPFNSNEPYNEDPKTYTHIMIPKEENSPLCYSRIPIDIKLEDIKNQTVKNILLTLESECKRPIENIEILKLFCKQRTYDAFSDYDNLHHTVVNETELEKISNYNIKCFSCLNSFNINDNVIYHPLNDKISIHTKCLNC